MLRALVIYRLLFEFLILAVSALWFINKKNCELIVPPQIHPEIQYLDLGAFVFCLLNYAWCRPHWEWSSDTATNQLPDDNCYFVRISWKEKLFFKINFQLLLHCFWWMLGHSIPMDLQTGWRLLFSLTNGIGSASICCLKNQGSSQNQQMSRKFFAFLSFELPCYKIPMIL